MADERKTVSCSDCLPRKSISGYAIVSFNELAHNLSPTRILAHRVSPTISLKLILNSLVLASL
jgi:hypothetical protein